jgi:16S rRNA (uracil1498-N3)-methyltransferase
MAGPRLFVPLTLSPGLELELPTDSTGHLRVLRVRVDQALTLFDGRGGEYPAQLLALDRRRAVVRLGDHVAREAESSLGITLIQGISKGERMDYTIQKAVELGATAVWPVFTERSVVQLDGPRLEKRERHWRGVAAAACEQCGRNRIPQILAARPLSAVWSDLRAGQRLVLDPQGDRRIGELRPEGSLSLLIGSEGGLTDAETAAAAGHGFIRLLLGPRILRTETAGIAALAALQALYGDL